MCPDDRWKVRVAGGGDGFMVEDMFKDLKVSVDCDEGLCRDGDKPGSKRVPAKVDQICTMDDSNVTNELSVLYIEESKQRRETYKKRAAVREAFSPTYFARSLDALTRLALPLHWRRCTGRANPSSRRLPPASRISAGKQSTRVTVPVSVCEAGTRV
jgi:hypothetical protein